MKIITEKIRTHLFQDGSFLYQIELQIPNGDIIDADILQIEKVIYTTCILVQILFFNGPAASECVCVCVCVRVCFVCMHVFV